MSPTYLTERFEQALDYAYQVHQTQRRKGSGVPYIAHLLSVAGLVLDHGGDEDQAIAALLHDAVEDQGGLKQLEQIQGRFGDEVAEIVQACSDTHEFPKPPWQQRKEKYLQHLSEASERVLLVSLADKVHNARDLLFGYHNCGEEVFDRFNGGKEGTLWYYRSLVNTFNKVRPCYLTDELSRTVAELERLIQAI